MISPLLLAFYGDDMTGSTDAMEALMRSGIRTRVFLTPPSAAALALSPGIEAVGFAGESRAMSPVWMDANLPGIFAGLRDLGAPLIHYKCCSTFDSSPEIGSIGRVLDIGLAVFVCGVVPIIVGVPELGRWTAFGQLFAKDKAGAVHRIDRHPVMSRHPKTPMHEADLRLHLRQQTDTRCELVDFRMLADGTAADAMRSFAEAGPCGVLIDNLDTASSLAIGRLLIAGIFTRQPGFVIGSSGVEYSLLLAMSARGEARPALDIGPVETVPQILVLSGSGSTTSATQITEARQAGYAVIAADSLRLVTDTEAEIERLSHAAMAPLAEGRSVIIATAQGPDDPQLAATSAALEARGLDSGVVLGGALGRIGRRIVQLHPGLARVVFSGGDTSSFGARALGVEWLDMRTTIVPGSPLCRAGSSDKLIDGLDVLFKGGQIGGHGYFEAVRQGRPPTRVQPGCTDVAAMRA